MTPSRFLAQIAAAALAWFVGKALNVPVWNDGWSFEAMGDRCDMALTAFMLVYWLTTPRTVMVLEPIDPKYVPDTVAKTNR